MRNWLVGLIVLLCTQAFAQQQPAVIAFDSVPDPLKLSIEFPLCTTQHCGISPE